MYDHYIDRGRVKWKNIYIQDLTNSHLCNIINYINKNSPNDLIDLLDLLETEKVYRENNDINITDQFINLNYNDIYTNLK